MRASPTPQGCWSRAATAAAVMAVALVYWWTIGTTGARLRPLPEHSDYYNLLARGFAHGHTYMQAAVDPRMLALPEADRPGSAPFLFDASLFHDRYYLYFGVIPVLAVQLPFTVLTGLELPEASVAALFGLAIVGAGLAWWNTIRRRWLPGLGGGWDVLFVISLGLCSAIPSTLRRPAFYEAAIAAGCAFTMLALWAVTRACASPRRALPWLGVAGAAVGFAAGSRANLAPAGVLLLVAAALIAGMQSEPGVRLRRFWRAFFTAAAAAAVVGAGLMAYNFSRFGNPLEFGHKYQLGVNPKEFFHVANLWHNLRLYYGLPPAVNGYFPFIAPADEGAKPADYIGREHVHGEWIWLAIAILAGLAALVARARRRGAAAPAPAWVLGLPALLFAANLALTASTGVRANRYMLDFHPALVVLTLALLATAAATSRVFGRSVRIAAVACVGLASAFNLLASIQAQGFYRLSDPVGYRRLATAADRIASRLEGDEVADRRTTVTWPGAGGAWRREPLLSAGTSDFEDTLWLEFNGEGRVRLAYQHGEYGSAVGDWFDFSPQGRSDVHVNGAFLLPPVDHPWYGTRAPDLRWVLKRHLRVQVDGVERFSRDVPSYDSSPRLQHWGIWHRGDATAIQTRVEPGTEGMVDESWARARLAGRGAIRFTVTLPRDRYGVAEPLIQAGDLGRFDTIAVRYTAPGRIQLVHDQLGAGATESAEFDVDYSRPQEVEIETPVATDGIVWTEKGPVETDKAPLGFRVRWNGRDVFAPALAPVPVARSAIAVGANAWKSSSSLVMFSGSLSEVEALVTVGTVGEGTLEAHLHSQPWLVADRGIVARFARADGEKAAVVWRTGAAAGTWQIGWLEAGETTWSRAFTAASRPIDVLRVQIPAAVRNVWVEVEADGQSILNQKTDFFAGGAASLEGISPGAWSGPALAAARQEAKAPELPGRVRFRFILPSDATGADPLLTAGKTGAADLLYLRSLGGGRYVFGVDHWGIGATESAPIALASRDVHTVLAELSSLSPAGAISRPGIRLWCDGVLAWDAPLDLYPALPAEVLLGRSLDGMSTGFPAFRGEIISIRTKEPAP